MLINPTSKLGLFSKKLATDNKSLFVYDFSEKSEIHLKDYDNWEPLDITDNGRFFAIKTYCVYRGASKTDIAIVERNSMERVYSTRNFFVYDLKFNVSGTKVLFQVDKKPFCLDLASGAITAEMPKSVMFYTGDLDRRTDAFYAPSLSVKDTCHVFDFTTGATTTQAFGVEGKIARLRFSVDSAFVYLTTEANVLHCFDRNLQPVWQTDFKRLGKQGGRIYPSGIFGSEDGKLLCLCAVDTETNNWGADYVIDASNGEIVKQIEGYQFRGRLACDFFGNKLLTYNLTTLDLITGEVSAKTIF